MAHLQTIYIDAFAGNGKIELGDSNIEIEGSARLALNNSRDFDKYIFIEKNKTYAKELATTVCSDFPQKKIRLLSKTKIVTMP